MNIGANDAGNCVGTSVGSGLLTYRRAVVLVAIFALLGSILQGGAVMDTMGRGIVEQAIPAKAILIAMLSAGLFVASATLFRMPVSTSQAIVGGLAGVGLAVGAKLNWSEVARIAQAWIVSPLLVGILAGALSVMTRRILRRIPGTSIWQRLPFALMLASACYVAFSLGANHVGTAMGPITNLGVDKAWLGLLGGISLALGVLLFGRRVTQTVGHEITRLDAVGAFSAQIAAALAVHYFSLLGIPVSTSQAIVGAVFGVGIVHGVRTVRGMKVATIALAWVVTPTAAGLFAYAVYRLSAFVTGS